MHVITITWLILQRTVGLSAYRSLMNYLSRAGRYKVYCRYIGRSIGLYRSLNPANERNHLSMSDVRFTHTCKHARVLIISICNHWSHLNHHHHHHHHHLSRACFASTPSARIQFSVGTWHWSLARADSVSQNTRADRLGRMLGLQEETADHWDFSHRRTYLLQPITH
jgi:hypothetical protein